MNNHKHKAATFCHKSHQTCDFLFFFLFSWKKETLKTKRCCYRLRHCFRKKKIHVHYKQISKYTEEVDDMGYVDKDHRAKSKEISGSKNRKERGLSRT